MYLYRLFFYVLPGVLLARGIGLSKTNLIMIFGFYEDLLEEMEDSYLFLVGKNS